MSNDLVIKGGLVILEGGEMTCDIAIKDGRISGIGDDLEGTKTIDATGLVVSPGMIDGHAHITDPGGGIRDGWEGYSTGTAACAKGGITSIVEMPLNQIPATTDGERLKIKEAAGSGKLRVDVASLGGLTPYNLDGGIQELDQGGVVGYKAFLATCGDPNIEGDFQNVDDYSLYEGMRQIAETGKVLDLHCENAAITDRLGEIAKEQGKKTLADYVATRPVFTELEAVRRAIFFAKLTGCRVNICHCTCKEAVDEVARARAEGFDITCETCPHYLYFTTDDLDAIGNITKCSPPIRDAAQRDALWERVENGLISFVVSDHSPCTPDLKAGDNAFTAWGGIAGIQNCVDVMFDEMVQKRHLPMTLFAKVMSTNVADRFGLTEKGRIEVGRDADLVLIEPNAPYTLKAEDLEYKNKVSPYVGKTIGAQVAATILRGETTYSRKRGLAGDCPGTFLKK
ncbi:allantoinase [Coriobacterium glomerans PW2]|uniref:Allantoinase n=1 Tax=Coriobacterium glomerans (strain ATCC 49209 / DSM 20642 / JCM 10262 / PW2) TaxID=700015 RepID=F2N960_CORGP|nr:allantoinase AllB [Coriobacterium glomerans]AEB07736.1 allantoinase [Coriobacterium glomerans PW2]